MPLKHSTVLMVPPDSFHFNTETQSTNSFQNNSQINDITVNALNEFNAMVTTLTAQGIQVLVLKQNKMLPDAVFPNNWFSTHRTINGQKQVLIYPMLTQNRQEEVTIEGLVHVLKAAKIDVDQIVDLRNSEGDVLEGTGSLVLDRENHLMYAALSPRTSAHMVNKVAKILNYQPVVFTATDEKEHPIYHTNVLMSVTKNYAIVCLDAIKDPLQKAIVEQCFKVTNKKIINISLEQMRQMCGNVLELYNAQGQSMLLMSSRAQQHFTKAQLHLIQSYSQLLAVAINTIETIGGGSARCMVAEINFSNSCD